ncbi:MAG: hypothetical protein VYA34_14345 [Myxococcota bacterium]|nr:hypothetical protein [Myxococcota bacterium]
MLLALPPLMDVQDIEKGQKGHCLTVFEGDVIEPFDFVVKGVMNNYLGPNRPLTLVKLLGEKPEFTGVVSGMSGSPCFIGERLIGALGYAFASFAKEPIAGITPISDMLAVFDTKSPPVPWTSEALKQSRHRWAQFEAQEFQALRGGDSDDSIGLVAIATPLAMSGVPKAVQAHFTPWFNHMGFEVGASAGTPKDKMLEKSMAPGAPVTAVLVRGDVDIGAVGTVTTVDKNKITAFGHPFMGKGNIEIPFAHSTILNTMVSQRRSFKMAATGRSIGVLTQDRLPAIAGELGREVSMIPVTGTIRTPQGIDKVGFEVVRDPALTPRLLTIAISSALGGRIDASQRMMIRMDGAIELEGYGAIPLKRVYGAELNGQLPMIAGMEFGRMASFLWNNPGEWPKGMRITFDATFDYEPIIEKITKLSVYPLRPRPGEVLRVRLTMKRSRGKEFTESVEFKVPSKWAGRKMLIRASGANDLNFVELIGAAGTLETLGAAVPWLQNLRAGGSVYVLVTGIQEGGWINGRHYSIPPSFGKIIESKLNGARKHFRDEKVQVIQRPGLVVDSRCVEVNVAPY